ncbi:hypothetical protein RAJCM14343_3762 [Rhodococcus aetherivorans]|uniref:Uncharacterized protein n=1 Tax=Rhodococcus aetherivorans TaxID=191292 RepID=A0ABQ0YPJ9_9NOCA|nr:hypothetical protein RAJCM14343_3762 [Rhodococcus aetherivorans]CCW12725.1 hypothetical protein EBESD8_32770 [Rhodococcus aetherivorans]
MVHRRYDTPEVSRTPRSCRWPPAGGSGAGRQSASANRASCAQW